jgi:GNAT superfamily N-acetyltransferase
MQQEPKHPGTDGEAERLVAGLRRAFEAVFAALDGARVEEKSGWRLFVCPSVPIPPFNAVWALEDPANDAISGLAQAMAEVEELGLPFGVVLRTNKAPGLEAEAHRLGLTAVERMPAMVMGTDELRDRGSRGLEIVRVRHISDLDRTLSVMAAGFEAPAAVLQAICKPAIAEAPGVFIYLATVDGEPVSTATSWLGDGGVGIFNVATPPSLRGRGYGAAVTAWAVEEGFAAGAELAWLQSSRLGEPVYRRMGFRQVDTHLLLTRPTPGASNG